MCYKTFWFEDSVKAGEFLYKFLLKKDIVLVKGSQGVRMEKIVKEIMDKPEHDRYHTQKRWDSGTFR